MKVLQPAFTAKSTNESYLSVFNEHCKPLLKEFEAKVGQGPFEHRPKLTYATIKMIFRKCLKYVCFRQRDREMRERERWRER